MVTFFCSSSIGFDFNSLDWTTRRRLQGNSLHIALIASFFAICLAYTVPRSDYEGFDPVIAEPKVDEVKVEADTDELTAARASTKRRRVAGSMGRPSSKGAGATFFRSGLREQCCRRYLILLLGE